MEYVLLIRRKITSKQKFELLRVCLKLWRIINLYCRNYWTDIGH